MPGPTPITSTASRASSGEPANANASLQHAPLFEAGIALTRRIHHRVPLLRAAVTVEGIDDDIPETGVIAIPRGLAEAANWTHTSSANPKAAWHTLIPFER